MARVRFYLREDKRSSDGDAPIHLVIRHKNRRITLATGIGIHPRLWNERSQEIRKVRGHGLHGGA